MIAVHAQRPMQMRHLLLTGADVIGVVWEEGRVVVTVVVAKGWEEAVHLLS